MKNFTLLMALAFTYTCVCAQNTQDYYISIKPEFALENIQKMVNADSTLTISMNNSDFSAFLNAKPVYAFEKAFPTAGMEKNKRVYKVTLDDDSHLADFSNRAEVAYAELVEEMEIELYIPNDYDYIDRPGPNTALELINAPLAWNVTQGDPNLLIGLYDVKYNLLHEDIVNKIAINQNVTHYSGGDPHGSYVASLAAGDTDNNVGIASIGFNSMLAIRSGGGANGVLELSQEPGVKVINISMIFSCSFSQFAADVFEEIWTGGGGYPPVVVVAAAGNGGISQNANGGGYCSELNGGANGYVYPASYDHVISVSSVGHLVPKYTHDPASVYGWGDGWADLHERFAGNSYLTHTNNDKVDIVAPGYHMLVAHTGVSSYKRGANGGTSLASPMVAGVAALMLAANPDLTPDEVRDILKDTADDIYQIPENAPYIGRLGAGRVNAYRAVQTAYCMANNIKGLDLMIRNSYADVGNEPDGPPYKNDTSDFWIRINQDDIPYHQNPNPNFNPNHVYVRVWNKSCEPSSGEDQLELYWAKKGLVPPFWPDYWDGSTVIQGALMGDQITTIPIPSIQAGESVVLETPWTVPNPLDYSHIMFYGFHWDYNLLARIVSNDDPISYPNAEEWPVVGSISNNNIALLNTTAVLFKPGELKPGGTLMIGNMGREEPNTYNFTFSSREEYPGEIWDEAEVRVTLDSLSWEKWLAGGQLAEHMEIFNYEEKELIVTSNDARLLNLSYDSDEWSGLHISFNFLMDEVTGQEEFFYHAEQFFAGEETFVGSGRYHIQRDPERPAFSASGHKSSIQSGNIELSANAIGEPAVYRWYAPDGTLLHTGKDHTFSPELAGAYKLEVIAEADAHKDYAFVEVAPGSNADQILSMAPNPTTGSVLVEYQVKNGNSAKLEIISFFGTFTDQYTLDLIDDDITIDLSGYPSGHYAVMLIVDGQAVHARQLVVQ